MGPSEASLQVWFGFTVILYFLLKFLLVLYRYISMQGQGRGKNTRLQNGSLKLVIGIQGNKMLLTLQEVGTGVWSSRPRLNKDLRPKLPTEGTRGLSQLVLPPLFCEWALSCQSCSKVVDIREQNK